MYETPSTLKLPFITTQCLILSSSEMTFFILSVFCAHVYPILSRRCLTGAVYLICAFNVNMFVVALFTVHYQKRRRRHCELVSSQTLMSLLIRSVLRCFFALKGLLPTVWCIRILPLAIKPNRPGFSQESHYSVWYHSVCHWSICFDYNSVIPTIFLLVEDKLPPKCRLPLHYS